MKKVQGACSLPGSGSARGFLPADLGDGDRIDMTARAIIMLVDMNFILSYGDSLLDDFTG
jgi:hypothetical protein